MANKKISELPYINSGEISGNTLVPLVTYYSASTGDTVHTYITDLQNYLTSGITASGDFLPLSGGTVTGNTIFTSGLTANTISATTYLNLPITGVTSVGTGITIFDSIVGGDIKINSITGDTLEKITTSLSANTIQVGINEQNLILWPLVVNGNRLIDGSVSYVSGLTFDVSPLNYIIDGQLYNILSSTQVTLNSGDSTFDRIDVIFADISGNTGVLEGTPSSNPEKPIVDSETQVEVTFVSVPANSTTPTITTELIYDENVGQPTEWNFLKFGNQTFRISGDSTAQSYSGSKSISVSGLTTSGGSWSNGFLLSATTATDTNQFATLQFAIRNLSGNSTNTNILIQFLSNTGTVLSTSPVYLYGGGATGNYIPYNASNTSSWQLISIPLWRFYLSNTNVYGVKFSYQVGSTVARHYFDKIELVEGSASSPPTNSWLNVRGDGVTTITAPNPNATLTISGGTNIGSFISGTSTVVLNLDNNINLNGITANTISATTYQNLPPSTFSGGTVTGPTNFTNGLTANTISATTYQNLPVSGLTAGNNINVSGSSGNFTISVTGLTQGLTGSYLPLSGGTVSGQTFFTSGVTITGDTNIADPYGNFSVDTTSRLLYNSGGINTINWDSGLLYDYNTTLTSVDFTNRTLNDSGGNLVVDWINLELSDSLNVSLNWTSRNLTDSIGGPSVDWQNRKLYKSGGTISFDWENGILTGQTNIQSSTISATTYQNLPLPAFVNPGTASTINWNISGSSNNYTATLTAATTLNVSNVRNGEYGTIILTQDSVGSRTITLGTINGTSGSGRHKVSSGGGGSIYLTSNPNAIDIVSFVYDGNILYWTVGNDYT